MADPTDDLGDEILVGSTSPPGWRRVPVSFSVMISESGLVSVSADAPRNLSATGRTLAEAFDALVEFADTCGREMGTPFGVLDGVKLR